MVEIYNTFDIFLSTSYLLNWMMVWTERWKKSIHGNLSWHSIATLVNEAECERDTNNTKKEIDS